MNRRQQLINEIADLILSKGLLNEIGDRSGEILPYTLKKSPAGYVTFFTVENEERGISDKIKVDIDFVPEVGPTVEDYISSGCVSDYNAKIVEVSYRTSLFDDSWTLQVTNLGKPFTVMLTVMDILEKVLKEERSIIEVRYQASDPGDVYNKRKDVFYQRSLKNALAKYGNFSTYNKGTYGGIIRTDVLKCLKANSIF